MICLIRFCVFAFLGIVLAQAALAQNSSNPKFGKLTEEFIHQSLALSPVSASQAGYHQHKDASGKTIQLDAELDDVGPEAMARQLKFYKEWRDRFRKETPLKSLGMEDQADWQLIDDQISYNLLELEQIQSYRHQPTIYVELIGNAIFLPLTQDYASQDVRVGHVLSRLEKIPRLLDQAQAQLQDSDLVFIDTAIEENEGNVDLVENMVKSMIPAGSALEAKYKQVATQTVKALNDFSAWMKDDLAKRKTASTTWRLGKKFYDQKFRYVMEVDATPEQVLADAENEMKSVRAEMLQIALPMHKQMYPDHSDHSDLQGRDRENKIIGEVLDKISQEHAQRDHLMDAVKADVASIQQFIREKKIVSLSDRDNLKIIPTPPFMRGVYSVAGFHSAPPLEPNSEAQYWVTPIDSSMPEAKAESKLREYNKWALQWLTIHEALPGHYIQYEHADNVQPTTRRVLRSLYGNGPYVEGWAEYIAQVMLDEGFDDNDARFRLVMRKIRLRVVSNAILDVRMQTMGMTDQQAMDLMTKDAFQTEAEATGKLKRAKLTSAQLPTYYVGLRQWLEIRKKYQEREGAKFNLMEFHNQVLDEGPMPLPILENIVMSK
jgi:uncharacterized protein (DUF885 family)